MDQTQGGIDGSVTTTTNGARRKKLGYKNQQNARKQKQRRWKPPTRVSVKPLPGQWPQGYYR